VGVAVGSRDLAQDNVMFILLVYEKLAPLYTNHSFSSKFGSSPLSVSSTR
jgi:hypothetical protein